MGHDGLFLLKISSSAWDIHGIPLSFCHQPCSTHIRQDRRFNPMFRRLKLLQHPNMIVFAAIVPHSPLLLPSIGKDKSEALAKTIAAYKEIEEALYLSKAETIVMISPHAQAYPDAFSEN